MTRRLRPTAPGNTHDSAFDSMIRVDHAGEYGAVRIYQGQLAVLDSRSEKPQIADVVRRMAAQEHRHLETFDQLINASQVRPTALEPVWRVAGFALGVATALLGEEAAMACTAAVEEVIDSHYAGQLDRLQQNSDLRGTIEEFRRDEIAHREEAFAHGAREAPGYRLLTTAIKAGCRIAIALSERV